MQRGLSWLRKAKDLDQDVDLQFVSLWIAFNAIYAENLQETLDEDQQRLRQFLLRLYGVDRERRIERCVWKNCSRSIIDWSNHPYFDQKQWDFQNQKIDKQEWKTHSILNQQRVQQALAEHDTVELLLIVFSRLYTLRNQIVHGGSTYNSAIMRRHLRIASQVLMTLLTQFMHVFLEHGGELDQEKPFYPMVQVC
ncbi:hypothetical protein [Acinetobacter sp. MB5]|uniref:hypothetical protein n=1 Tax=Acinetobacter sp. MB5 TaxID=2069438 RepID=UPI0039B6F260